MSTTEETLRQARRARIALDRTVDQTTRELVRAWARAWREVVDEYVAAVDDLQRRWQLSAGKVPPRHVVNRAARAQKALEHVAGRLNDLGNEAGVFISGKIPGLVKQSKHWSEVLVRSQLPKGDWTAIKVGWTEPSDRAIDAIVKRTTQQIHSLTKPLSRDAERQMKRVLVRGISSGMNPRKAARQMVLDTQHVFNGGLPRAENIARTEMLDAYREADRASREANSMVRGWMWLATLDHRTCGACLAMAGTEHPVSEHGPDDHQQGRCVAVPVMKTWKDLGIDLPEPEPVRQDGKAWFDQQDEATQKSIIGPGRLKAYQDGRIEFSDLAVPKENPNWRRSFAMPSVDSLPDPL